MDLTWPSDLDDYRAELRAWFRAELAGRSFPKLRRPETIGPLREWERTLYDAGLAAVHWPVAYGGQDADPLRTAVFNEEYIRSGAPKRLNRQALALAGPTIMLCGTEDQKDRWLRNILSCEELWCQGFSEPDAGSDLLALRTRAVRDGDDYIVNGQKIWSSNGPIADWTFALVRTDETQKKHRGLSYLMIDLRSPGVEVRPINQIDGLGDFAEVFYTDVVVPVANRIGDEHDGWAVALKTLSLERGAVAANAAEMSLLVDDVERLIASQGALGNIGIASDFVRLKGQARRYQLNVYAALSSPRALTVERLGAIHKLTWSVLQTSLYELGMRAIASAAELGSDAIADEAKDWHERYWLARASLIYSGTNEVQRNIVGERVLGLPKEGVRA